MAVVEPFKRHSGAFHAARGRQLRYIYRYVIPFSRDIRNGGSINKNGERTHTRRQSSLLSGTVKRFMRHGETFYAALHKSPTRAERTTDRNNRNRDSINSNGERLYIRRRRSVLSGAMDPF